MPEMEIEGKRKKNKRKQRQSQKAHCGECLLLNIGQLPLEGAIILHRGSLSSFPPSAKHTGLNTLTSEDLLHLNVAAIPQTAGGGSNAKPPRETANRFDRFSWGNIVTYSFCESKCFTILPSLDSQCRWRRVLKVDDKKTSVATELWCHIHIRHRPMAPEEPLYIFLNNVLTIRNKSAEQVWVGGVFPAGHSSGWHSKPACI